MLTEQPNLVRAAREVMAMGPRVVVAKQGEYGAALFTGDGFFALPAYPARDRQGPDRRRRLVRRRLPRLPRLAGVRPGRGDAAPRDDLRLDRSRPSTSRSSAAERARTLTRDEIDARFEEFRRMTSIEPVPARG